MADKKMAGKLIKKDAAETFRAKFIHYFGALFFEKKGSEWIISIGRISWWLAFAPALYVWIEAKGQSDISEHHLTILLLLAGYNFGKKVVDGIISSKKPPKPEQEQETDGPG